MIILKSHQIKLSHNLNPKSERANIASCAKIEEGENYDNHDGDEEGTANIAAFNGNRPKCEICFRPHSIKYCPYRGKAFWPPSIVKRANQYNIKHNEFAPPIPPRDPRPPPQSIKSDRLNEQGKQKKPLVGKKDKATISSLLSVLDITLDRAEARSSVA